MRLNPIPLMAALSFFCIAATAQQKEPYTLLLNSGSFIPPKNITAEKIDSVNRTAAPSNQKSFAIIQFEKIPTDAQREQLKQSGIELLDYIPNNAYTVTITGSLNTATLLQTNARAIVNLSPEQKMQPNLAKGILPAWAVKTPGTVDVWISFPKSFSYTTVNEELKQKNFDVISSYFKDYRILALRISQQRISELASLPFIEYVQPAPHEDQLLNHQSVPNARANVLNSALIGGRNLHGDSVVIGIGDDSDPLRHIDFSGRVINRAAVAGGGHGIHVTGTAAGAGIVKERFKGYAPKATILSQAFSNIISFAPSYVQDYDMVVTNNSYGNIVGDCNYNGVYDLYSRILDQQAFDLPNLQNVFAAGNSGGMSCSPYPTGFKTVLGSFQASKNGICVGNTTENAVINPGSSRGPVQDGRLKPEISTQGTKIYSTYPVNTYVYSSGTSMSTPAVTGGLALLYQRYRQLHSGTDPKNGLMKALICNGGTDLGNTGPDYTYGFGWMNLLRSVQMMEANNYFDATVTNGATNAQSITVPANTAQLKVMLYWNDPPAAVLSSHTLVNDLDLKVIGIASDTTLPLILDTIPGNVNNTAATGEDHINNIEQVVINNPVAGVYTANVKGTSITQNSPQEYFLVYDVVPVSTVLTHPIGGEKFVPGDSIYISWDSWGDPANAFTIQFSSDNGATWIDTTAPANARQLKWFVPNVITDQAKIRITRNSTAMSSTSEAFTILGAPLVSLATVQCEGYISLKWNTITGATDYEVMQLKGSDMVSVGTTTDTIYTISGLTKDSVYWVSVRARLNGNAGRRSDAISRQPNNGTCIGTISDNDLKLDTILAPSSGRQFTSTQLSATTTITTRIKNLDDAAINKYAVKYSVNGGTWVTDSVLTPIAAGATDTHNFSTTYDFSATGTYTIKVVVVNAAASDPITANDTMAIVVKQLANPVINLATTFLDDMETATNQTYSGNQVGLNGLDRYDFSTSSSYGRIRSFINSGIAYSGSKALTIDSYEYNAAGTADSLFGTFNLSSYDTATDDIRLDFHYKNHGELQDSANKVWIRGNDTQPWIKVYDLYANQNDADGTYKLTSSIEMSDFLKANLQNFSSSFQVRWGQWGQILASDDFGGAGYTFDDIRLYKAVNDIQMISIDSPIVASCGLNATTPVKISVRNSANTTINSIPVKFQVDNGAIISETIASITSKATVQYTFTATANLAALGNHVIKVWVDFPGDSFRENDTAEVALVNSPVITSFPYLENFESGNGGFYTGGKKSSWEYGTPASPKISCAASGSKAWKTSLTGNYNDLEYSYLYSPCYNISAMTNPTLSVSIALDIEDCGNSLCDGAFVEYSADGKTWTRLGANGQGTNWYNKTYSGNNLWSIQDYTRWHVATIPLPTGLNNLRLRFVMSSDPATNREGIGLDDIHIYDNTFGIYDGVTMGSPVTQNISGGNNWIDFTSGGKLVASILPNNQNMGNTDVQAYINTGAVRYHYDQYYHDRNITIKPVTRNLADSVTIRFYFLDMETDTLIRATGCSICSKPASAYQLGVSKYNDSNINFENGTLADDNSGTWLFIKPAQTTIVPFDKGYYAEFKVKDFSEFWLNDGGQGNLHSLPVQLIEFTAQKKQNKDVLLQWTVANEIDVNRYEIELAKGNAEYSQNHFATIGQVRSAGNSNGQQQYNFADVESNKSGVRYYRLKIIDNDGSFKYSPIRPVVFNDEISWQVYPNPSDGIFNLIYQAAADQNVSVQVYDVNGKNILNSAAIATGFIDKLVIDLHGVQYAPGLYFVQTEINGKTQSFRLLKK
ncbi:MAG: S8 family serine peptidase [Bacteroidetes bacterium]|nr:S8 family serine peptidase [Bacteroidota bacterium]MBS1930762.1 S8 family serine peptidase [Bacteroidota bacterium]